MTRLIGYRSKRSDVCSRVVLITRMLPFIFFSSKELFYLNTFQVTTLFPIVNKKTTKEIAGKGPA